MKLVKDMNPVERFMNIYGITAQEGDQKIHDTILVSQYLLDNGVGEMLGLRKDMGAWSGEWGGYAIRQRPDVEFVASEYGRLALEKISNRPKTKKQLEEQKRLAEMWGDPKDWFDKSVVK